MHAATEHKLLLTALNESTDSTLLSLLLLIIRNVSLITRRKMYRSLINLGDLILTVMTCYKKLRNWLLKHGCQEPELLNYWKSWTFRLTPGRRKIHLSKGHLSYCLRSWHTRWSYCQHWSGNHFCISLRTYTFNVKKARIVPINGYISR